MGISRTAQRKAQSRPVATTPETAAAAVAESRQKQARKAAARSARSSRRSTMGYVVLGLGATAAGLGAAMAAVNLSGRFSVPVPAGPAPDPAGATPSRQLVKKTFADSIKGCAEHPPDRRPQASLPATDTSPGCERVTSHTATVAANWVNRINLETTDGPEITQLFELDFPVDEQVRMISELIARSQTLDRMLNEAHDRNDRIAWARDLDLGGRWFQNERTMLIGSSYRVTPEEVLANPASVVEGTLRTVHALAHELNHAENRFHFPDACMFVSQAAHDEAFIEAMAIHEAKAVISELTVGQEVFDATGVVLPAGEGNYRCGEAQAIFYDRGLGPGQRLDALAAYMRRTHPSFKQRYWAAAADAWTFLRNRDCPASAPVPTQKEILPQSMHDSTDT